MGNGADAKTSISLGCFDREEVLSVLSILKRYMTPSLGALLLDSTWKDAGGASHSRGGPSIDLQDFQLSATSTPFSLA